MKAVPSTLTKIVAFGFGSLTFKGGLNETPIHQHTLMLLLRDIVFPTNELACIAQDPDYTDADRLALASAGIGVVEDPRAFLEVDEQSIVLSFSPNAPVKQIVTEISRPRIIIWMYGSINFNYPSTDPESPRVDKMIRDEYERVSYLAIMRTRKSNRSKRYSEAIDYGLDDDEDTNRTPTRRAAREASDDDNFVVDAGAAPAEDDDFIAPDESDVDIKDDSFLVVDSDEDANGTGNVNRKKRSYHNRRKLPPGHDANAMDPYPQESRFTQTRMHHGIFSSWIRTAFWDDFYGPDPHAAAQAADMFRKWAPYEVLPCKLLDEEWALQPTPWVRDDFEALEAAIAREWYERVRKEHHGQVQRPLDELEATPYLSSTDGALKILSGPYPDQQQCSLGLNETTVLSSDGLPYGSDTMETDKAVDKPAGWMFDVGGLVLGMSWLPRATTTTQILALAVSPFTDQDYDWQQEQDYVNDEMERGRIQLWEFKGEQTENVGFFHSRAFSATMRKVIDGDALLSCLAVGVQHPFVLIAFLDGTVWACNPMHRVFAPRHYPPAWKLKLFEHEHIPRMRLGANLNPPDDPCRGVSRIVQGWKPVMNKGPQALINLARNTPSARPPKKKSRAIPRLKKTKKKAEEEADPGAAGAGENDEDGGLYADPEKIILREPLSRATAMAWNPNMEFACWAAISLASGLVKVMDLGVDYLPE
ncbi:hypothetical protein ACHAPP_003897 [Verticillium nonalfalfae]